MYSVFLVDDEEIILNQTARTVPWMDNGFEVIGTETNPKKAVERVLELKPDVVFSDLRMPHLDGHLFMRTIRENNLDTEFVMLSAYGTFEDARTFFQQDGFDYLLKPLQMQEVQLVLEKLAGKLAQKNPSLLSADKTVNPAFSKLIEYIEGNYKERLTLEQLGKMFGLSPGYICTLFSKMYNTTLTCYLTEVRMKHAKTLIEGGELSLKCIAIECGYKDYFYFNKVFKGYYRMSPSQFVSFESREAEVANEKNPKN